MNVVNISPNQLKAGMIIADDIYSSTREKIVAKNTIVNPKIISKLKLFTNQTIPVLIPQALSGRMSEENPEAARANKTKESLEFKKFKKQFSTAIDSVKDGLQSVLQSPQKKFDQETLLGYVDDLLAECGNTMHTFDMLHNMRDSDDLTYTHSVNVALICHSIASWLNYPEEEAKLLTLAGLLHDIGKTKIPPIILNKRSGLSDEEYAIMKRHPEYGYEILENSPIDERVKDAVLSHHERYDGNGYPYGLKGHQTSDFAKIVAIADVYDAMTSKRTYRANVCPFDVVATLESEGYSKYDPAFLLPFLKHIVQSYINAPVLLSNSLVGTVVMINQDHLSKPIVKVGDTFYDLSKEKDLTIQSLL